MSSTRTASQVASKPQPSQANAGTNDHADLESANPEPLPPYRHPLVPGFHKPPPFLTFLRYNWFDIATQLLCLLAAILLYTFCPPLLPRYFPVFPGIEKTTWGMKHSQPYRPEYVDTIMSGVVSFVGPALVMGAIALWGTRGFGDGNAAVRIVFLSTSILCHHLPLLELTLFRIAHGP
jgi:diacylglycerol diphosphate phosphatase/phosphatidate phosphatase